MRPEPRVRSRMEVGSEGARTPAEPERADDAVDPAGSDPTVTELLRTARERHADRRAITAGRAVWSHRELGHRVVEVAAGLWRCGVRPGHRVAVHEGRGVEQIVAVLAVLEAGAGFVPLDPAYPQARRESMLATARATLVIGPCGALETDAPTHTVAALTELGVGVDPGDEQRPAPDDPASTYFTSGSTGKPKGIDTRQRNLVAFLDGFDAAVAPPPPGECADQRWLQLTSSSFDPWCVEVLWALARGHEIVVAPPGSPFELVASGMLASVLEERAVTHLQCTPTFLRMLVSDDACCSALSELRQLFVGGEVLPAALARRVAATLPRTRLTNLYGPTETTVWSFAHDVDPAAPDPVPIGRMLPVPGGELRILPVEASDPTVGELWIGGAGVAAGYLDRPDATAASFVDGGYRTGDLVRRRADGCFEFHGRTDDQVKVNGHRVELAEIDAAVSAHDAVEGAVAVLVEGRLLVAVTIRRGHAVPSAEEIRRKAAEVLPAPVVPTEVVVLDTMARTPSGKSDRNAIAAMVASIPGDGVRGAGSGRADTPGALNVASCRALFAEVLGVSTVGADDDFFDLAGDSVIAMRLVGRILDTTGVRLGIASLIEASTPATLAALVERHRAGDHDGADRCTVALRPRRTAAPPGTGRPFFCVHGIGGNVVNFLPLARALPDDLDMVGIQARGVDGAVTPDVSIDVMIDRYVAGMRSVQPGGPYALGGYSHGGLIALELGARLVQQGDAVEVVVLFDTEPFAGARTRTRRVVNAARNLVEDGPTPVRRGIQRALARRLSMSRRELEASLGHGAPSEHGYVDLTTALSAVFRGHRLGSYPFRVVLFEAADRRPGDTPRSAWSGVDIARFDIVRVAGDHLTMLGPPYTAEVARRLTDLLAPSAR